MFPILQKHFVLTKKKHPRERMLFRFLQKFLEILRNSDVECLTESQEKFI